MSGHTLVNPLSLGVSTAGNTAGNTGLTQVPVVIQATGAVTVSQATGVSQATIQISVAPGAGGVAAYGVSTGGNTLGTSGTGTGTIVIAAIGAATASQATAVGGQTVSISVQPPVLSAGVSTDGNTAGSTGLQPGSIKFVGQGLVTLSQSTNASGATVSIVASTFAGADVVTALGVSTGGNTAGTTGLRVGSVILAGVSGITLSQATGVGNSATISIVGPGAAMSASFFEKPWGSLNNCATDSANPNVSLQRVQIGSFLSATRLDMVAHLTCVASQAGQWSISVAVYTRSVSTLSMASSTFSGVAFASLGASNNSDSYNGISGTRIRSFAPATWAFTPGEYWFGVINSVVGSVATTGSVSILGDMNVSIGGVPGGNNDTVGGRGIFSAASGAFPASINVTDVLYCNTVANNASGVARQPYFRMYGTGA